MFKRGRVISSRPAAKQRILLHDVPPDYTRIHSSLGEAPPKSVLVLPVLWLLTRQPGPRRSTCTSTPWPAIRSASR